MLTDQRGAADGMVWLHVCSRWFVGAEWEDCEVPCTI